MEIKSLIEHAGFLQSSLEFLQVIGIQHTVVFVDLTIVGIGLELSGLMTDHRHGNTLDAFREVDEGVGIGAVDDSAVVNISKREGTTGVGIKRSPFLSTVATGSEIVHSILPSAISQEGVGAEGVQFCLVYFAVSIDESCHGLGIPAQFVA